jgi:hypothetical protein
VQPFSPQKGEVREQFMILYYGKFVITTGHIIMLRQRNIEDYAGVVMWLERTARNEYRIVVGKPLRKCPLGRPNRR